MDEGQVRNLIDAAFPEIEIRNLAPFREGWANATWLVNGGTVFRFPKTAQAAASTRKEIALVPELARTLPVPVPDFRYAAPAGAPGHPWPFAGYPMVEGTPLADLGPTGSGRRNHLAPTFAASVADFLTALHGFPVSKAAALGVPGGTAEDWRAWHASWWLETRDLVRPHLGPVEAAAASLIEVFLQDDRHFRFTPVLLHHDLSEDHLLVDPITGTLTGVIDFEDAIIGDPAFDFIGVTNLGREVLDLYRGPRDKDFEERMRFYTRLQPLHKLRYGVETGRRDYIHRALARLRHDLTANG